jgi:hypothetical protein
VAIRIEKLPAMDVNTDIASGDFFSIRIKYHAPDGIILTPDKILFAPCSIIPAQSDKFFAPNGVVFTFTDKFLTPSEGVFAPSNKFFTLRDVVFTFTDKFFASSEDIFAPSVKFLALVKTSSL